MNNNKKLLIRKKSVAEIEESEFFGEGLIPLVDGGIYYMDTSGEGFNRPYISLPEKNEFMKYDSCNLKHFVRITSNQYTFWDIPIGTFNSTVSFAATHEIIGIKPRELQIQDKSSNNNDVLVYQSPAAKVHPLILELIVDTVNRYQIEDPEVYADLINRIYQYNKRIESMKLPLYNKTHNTSRQFQKPRPGSRTLFQFNHKIPDFIGHVLNIEDLGKVESPTLEPGSKSAALESEEYEEIVHSTNDELIRELNTGSATEKHQGSFSQSFADKVRSAFESGTQSVEEPISEDSVTEESQEDNRLPAVESETPKETDDVRMVESKFANPNKIHGEIDPSLLKNLPSKNIPIDHMTRVQMFAFCEVCETYRTSDVLKAIGYSRTSGGALYRRYLKVKERLEGAPVITPSKVEEPEKEPVSQEVEPEKQTPNEIPDSTFEMMKQKPVAEKNCEDLVRFVDEEEIERYFNKSGNPTLDGDPTQFCLMKMRSFLKMDRENSNQIQSTFKLKSKSQVIRLRGKIMNEMDRRGIATMLPTKIPHRSDFIKFADGDKLSLVDLSISSIGALVFLTDVAKYPADVIQKEYHIDAVQLGYAITVCNTIYNKTMK